MSAQAWRWEARVARAYDGFDPKEPRDARGKWTKADLDAAKARVKVIKNPRLNNEATTKTGVHIETGPKFDALSAQHQAEILTHEFAHFHGLDDWYLKNKSDWDLFAKTSAGHLNGQTTPGEIMAEAYSVAWHDPQFLMKHAPDIFAIVREGAQAVGIPVPPLPTHDGFDPAEKRDDHGRWTAGSANTAAEWEAAFGPGAEPTVHEIHQTRIAELNTELEALGKLEDDFNAAYAETGSDEEHQRRAQEYAARIDAQAERVQKARDATRAAWQGVKAEMAKEHATGVRIVVSDVARSMDFPIADIEYREDSYNFELNGKKLTAAGLAHLETGKITIFPHAVTSVRDAEGVMAHEIGHHIFESVIKETGLQRRAAMGAPPQMITLSEGAAPKMLSILKPDGTLRESHEGMLPIFAEMGRYDTLGQKLHEEDGVSQYSRDWWASHDSGAATSHQAQHETFAEITRIVYESKRDTGKMWASEEAAKVGRIWKQYFTSINRANKKIRE